MSTQRLNSERLSRFTFVDARFSGIQINGLGTSRYSVSIADSIARILTTRLGERIMRPQFGSNLYLLRDRTFNSEWRVLATRYIFEALQKNEPRVKFKQLHFTISPLGQHDFYLELDAND
ncbi:MAG: GPW/gp25 family protein [Vibrio sp.]